MYALKGSLSSGGLDPSGLSRQLLAVQSQRVATLCRQPRVVVRAVLRPLVGSRKTLTAVRADPARGVRGAAAAVRARRLMLASRDQMKRFSMDQPARHLRPRGPLEGCEERVVGPGDGIGNRLDP